MPALHRKYLDDIQDRIKSSSNNLLAMAAPLESGTSTKPKTLTEEKAPAEIKEAPAQKAMIVVALLSVGAFRPAITLLAQYPWLVDVQKDIADLLLRMLKVSIGQLFDKQFAKERNQGFLRPRPRYASPGIITTPVRKSQLTLCAPPPPSTQSHDCIFFYPQWSTTVPICQSLDDVVDVVEPLMRLVGVHIARDPLFLTKFLRLGKVHLTQSVCLTALWMDNMTNLVILYRSTMSRKTPKAKRNGMQLLSLNPRILRKRSGSLSHAVICFRHWR